MVDVTFQLNSVAYSGSASKRLSLRTALKRKLTAAFLMTPPQWRRPTIDFREV